MVHLVPTEAGAAAGTLSDTIQKVMPSVVRVRAVRRQIGFFPSDEMPPNPPPRGRLDGERRAFKISVSNSLHPCAVAHLFNPNQPMCPEGLSQIRQRFLNLAPDESRVRAVMLPLPPGIESVIALDPQNSLLVYGTDDGRRQIEEIIRRFQPPGTVPFGEIIFEQMTPGFGQISEGAGVIWRADGYIVTTFSIVNRADRVEVTLNDGRTLEAKLTGVDPTIDLAVVKVDADKLPTPTIGDASKAKVGEPVFAIGHPANFTGTVITGIVSGLNRTLPIGNQVLLGLIQTDLAIAPGFSGGPLANGRGEIIGINVAQFRPPQPMFSNQPTPPQPNLSFALSISEVKRSADEIIAHGKVFRPFLGVQLFDVDEEKQKDTRLPDNKGAFVANVPPDSPARRADIRPGDVIRRMGDKEILNAAAAMDEIRSRKPGDKLTIEIWRDGAPRTVEVTLADMPREPRQPAPPFPPGRFGPDIFGPIEFGPPRPALRILTPKDNETVKGNVPIRIAIPQRERFAWVGVWVDEQFVAMSKLSDEPFTLDTTKFPNGVRVVRVKVINLNNDAAPGASVRIRVENEK